MDYILNIKSLLYFAISFLLIAQLPLQSQEIDLSRLFLDVTPDTFLTMPDSSQDSVRLPAQFIIPHSDKVYKNKFKLLREVHYRFKYKEGVVVFFQPLSSADSLMVIYQSYPIPFIPVYFHHELKKIETSDSTTGDKKTVSGILGSRFLNEFDSFSDNLQRSGSIVRGIEIGSNRDLTINSGLNLQLSGHITPNVQLVAALTDESTPIQPEGNTQTLREVDKVFVKINSPYLGGTLGDFNLSYGNTVYGNLTRKLQGISAYGTFNEYRNQITYATSRGTFHTNQFLGQEGNQGPYQLIGMNGEPEIIVLAGTEKVFVNGERQIRGENNEYIIDYSLGQITFSNKRLITSEDRIEVDFEYANSFQRYGKSLIGISAARETARRGLSYDVRLFREWDDTKNLLEDSAPLTQEEEQALADAGDDQFAAGVSGAAQVAADEGNYVKRDTLLASETYQYFKYVGENNGNFRVRFSGVGKNNGSYIKERLGVFRFVGPGLGNYLPVKLVPLAGEMKFADATLAYNFGRNFTIKGEAAVSNMDKNVFSGKDDHDNVGLAYTVGSSYSNDAVSLFGRNIGEVNGQASWKLRQHRFTQLDRQFQPEYNYTWNLSDVQINRNENTLESTIQYRPVNTVRLRFDGGLTERGKSFNSNRGRGQLSLTDSTFVRSESFYELVQSSSEQSKSDWNRLGGALGRKFGRFFPYVDYRLEDRKVEQDNNQTVTGFNYTERAAGLKIFSLLGMNWHYSGRERNDFLYDPDNNEKKQKLALSWTHKMNFNIMPTEKWQGKVSFVYREKNYQPFFEQLSSDSIVKYQPDPQFQDTTWRDRQSHLANIELQYRNKSRTIDSRWGYQVASELLSLQEKVFVNVGENNGNYRFDEDLQEYVPDPLGEFLLITVPTGKFESVTNIEASWQLRYRPKLGKENYSGLNKLWQNISTFTFLKVEERSREENIWQLYILNLEKFHNEETSLRGGYTINQDVFFFERNPDFGFSLRSRFRDNISNEFVDAEFNETRTFWERSLSWRQKLWAKKLSHELTYTYVSNRRNVSASPSRNRNITGHTPSVKLNFRPVYAWQFRFTVERGWQQDRAVENQLTVRYWELRPQINYSVSGKARGIIDFTYLNVNVAENPSEKPIPYEMGKGKKEGDSFLWNARFEYFISSHVTMTLNYNGRKDAGTARTIHLGQAEIRAFF